MKKHITRAVAFLMVMMMIVTAVPTTVLAEVAALVAPDAASSKVVSGEVTLDKFDAIGPEQGKVTMNTSAYEPLATDDPTDPFLPGNAAWIDLSQLYYGSPATPEFPILKWSANTSVYNTTGNDDADDVESTQAFPDVDLIHDGMWPGSGNATDGGDYWATQTSKTQGVDAYVYNRYDAMQGKWGLTFDCNVSYSDWLPGKTFNLSDTPFLYFSTEADDSVEMAISLKITDPNGVTKWYTVTDNNNRPGIGDDTRDYSMIPDVTVSANWDELQAALAVQSGYKADGTAATSVDDDDYLYTAGSVTGCIDFTYLIGLIYTQNANGENIGRAGMNCTVESVRVDFKGNAPSRMNYLYFGPNYGYTFTPQVTVGEANTYDASIDTTTTDRDIANGWENGQAITITNTPNTPQLIKIDTQNATNLFTSTESSSGVEYVTLTIPIQKWYNSLSDARKFIMSLDVETYGPSNLEPTVSLWGNPLGSDGAAPLKHTDGDYVGMQTHGGVRRGREGILAVLGNGVYLAEPRFIFHSTSIDRTLGNSCSYDGTESWFDLLRSPYMYDETVTAANTALGITENMIGYVYVSSVRICVEKGTILTIQNMRCEGCSAGLNMQNADGSSVLTAYDGGSGVQPEVDINSTSDGGFTTYSSLPAAYGPYLRYSNYTTKKLLTDADGTWDDTSDKFGKTYEIVRYDGSTGYDNDPFHITKWPADEQDDQYNDDGTKFANLAGNNWGIGYKAGYSGAETPVDGVTMTVYATFHNKRDDMDNLQSSSDGPTKYDKIYGLVGVMQNDGTYAFGWTPISVVKADGTVYQTYMEPVAEDPGTVYDFTAYLADQNLSNHSWFINNESTWQKIIAEQTQDNWTYSNFSANPDFAMADGTTAETKAGQYPSATDVVGTDAAAGYYTKLQYGNGWGTATHAATTATFGSTGTTATANTIIGGWRLSETSTANSNWSAVYTRTFREPVVLSCGNDHGSYPVLYFDIQNTSGTAVIGLVLEVSGQLEMYYLDIRNSTWVRDATHFGGYLTKSATDTRGYTVNADGSKTYYDTARGELGAATYYGYVSFENMIRQYGTAKIVSMSVLSWDGSATASDLIFRRFEILYESEAYLDDVNHSGELTYAEELDIEANGWGNYADTESVLMYDGFNILNEAYYYNHKYSGDGTSVNSNDAGELYGKKGWKAVLRYKTNGTDVEHTNAFPAKTIATGEASNIYEYRTSLGHMRVWLDGTATSTDNTASLLLETNATYNINNFKYLYYSYSMRDAETGFTVENDNSDKSSGFTIVVKEKGGVGVNAYREQGESGWGYEGNYSGADLTYNTSANGVVDLAALANRGDATITQIVIYMKNNMPQDTEFYINYLYLSNAEPTEMMKNIHNTTEYQYYYMMDNTGDRYSARFPVVDNPSGAVTNGLDNTAADARVNPLKIERGQTLVNGEFFNGYHLSNIVSVTQKDFTLSGDEAIDAIWFYERLDTEDDTDGYWEASDDEILEYYMYLDSNGDGERTVQDMKWSFGRWATSTAALNTLYKDAAGTTAGTLLRRYATNDEVLLRTGIQPRTFLSYFDAQGGKMVYEESSDDVKNDVEIINNSYYITESVLYSYYSFPTNHGLVIEPTKYGYTFDGWYFQSDNATIGDVEGTKLANGKYEYQLTTLMRKSEAKVDNFYAKWNVDTNYQDTTYTATFFNQGYVSGTTDYTNVANANNKWFAREATMDTTQASDMSYDAFTVNVPNMMTFRGQPLQGWYLLKQDGDTYTVDTSTLYTPGMKLLVMQNVYFIPVVDVDAGNRVTIDVTNGELYVRSEGEWYLFTEEIAAMMGATIQTSENNGVTTYTGVPNSMVLKAVPTITEAAGSTYGWTLLFGNNDTRKDDTSVSLINQQAVATNYQAMTVSLNDEYLFAPETSMSISYTTLLTPEVYEDGVVVSTLPYVLGSDYQLKIPSQYTVSKDQESAVTILAKGTLYTHASAHYYVIDENGAVTTTRSSFADTIDANMLIDTTDLTAAKAQAGEYQTMMPSAIYRVQASGSTATTNQYGLMVTADNNRTRNYYARGYVIYQVGDKVKVAYSDVLLVKNITVA